MDTKRLKLIPCSEDAIAAYATKDYEVGPHIGRYLEQLKEDGSLLGWGVWLVIDKQSNRIIGDIGFKGKPDTEKSVEVGYGITSAVQNKGYATEALNRLIQWAFHSNQVDKVVAECLVDNKPSIRVLEKLKMNRMKTVDGMLYWELTK